ncbi:MAG: hypothetical protein M9894_35395 [Planctomycetes bacterium]|nr:hypothetical protein [Planctomycetota bacterium]
MDEFLDKMQEDQRRMRRFLRAHGPKFKDMGEALAEARARRGRVFIIGEPPLDSLAPLLAEDYLTHLPALPVDLTRPRPASVDPDDSDEVAIGRAASAKQVGRHLHPGDVILAFLSDGADRETRMVLESARARRVPVLVIGGLAAKGPVRRLATVRLNLPTEGIKTIVESSFVVARILARVSRAAVRAGEPEEEHLVQATCDTCNERVFHDERLRGREVACPLCRATMKVPRDSARRAIPQVGPPVTPEPAPQRRRRLRPSVLNVKALRLDEAPSDPAPPEPDDEVVETPPSRSPRPSSRSEARSDVGKALVAREPTRSPRPGSGPAKPPPPPSPDPNDASLGDAPMGLISQDQPERPPEPSFGSDIMVGSDVVPAAPSGSVREAAMATTASADPFALEDGFLQDLEMPDEARASASSSADGVESASRRLSARFTIAECRMRWGRGGYPDESGPTHELITLSPLRLAFFLDPDDEAGSTLQKGDELWLRLEIPAFIEPVLAQGILMSISGTSGVGRRGTRVELEFQDLDPVVRRKLARAAESMGAPA